MYSDLISRRELHAGFMQRIRSVPDGMVVLGVVVVLAAGRGARR